MHFGGVVSRKSRQGIEPQKAMLAHATATTHSCVDYDNASWRTSGKRVKLTDSFSQLCIHSFIPKHTSQAQLGAYRGSKLLDWSS